MSPARIVMLVIITKELSLGTSLRIFLCHLRMRWKFIKFTSEYSDLPKDVIQGKVKIYRIYFSILEWV